VGVIGKSHFIAQPRQQLVGIRVGHARQLVTQHIHSIVLRFLLADELCRVFVANLDAAVSLFAGSWARRLSRTISTKPRDLATLPLK
jgi:hypothetical protein